MSDHALLGIILAISLLNTFWVLCIMWDTTELRKRERGPERP